MRPDSKGDTNTQALIMFLNKYADWNPASRALDEMRNAKLIDDIARTLREALPTETADALMDYAMALREDNGLTTALQEHSDSSTLIQDYADSIEMRRHLAKTHQRTLRNLKANRSNL